MKQVGLLLGILFALFSSPGRVGSVIAFGNGTEVNGKVTLTPGAIHVEGSSSGDIKLPDVLEVDFSDAPFQLDYFSPNGTNVLPPDWKAQDIGKMNAPSTWTYADGTLTVTSNGSSVDRKEPEDQYFFIGRPCIGDGQWTVRVGKMDIQDWGPEAGLIVRNGLDPGAVTRVKKLEAP